MEMDIIFSSCFKGPCPRYYKTVCYKEGGSQDGEKSGGKNQVSRQDQPGQARSSWYSCSHRGTWPQIAQSAAQFYKEDPQS